MKILIYASVNLNLVDGSSVWVESLAETLTAHCGCQVIVLSRESYGATGVSPSLAALPGVKLMSSDDFPVVLAQHPKRGDPFAIEKMVKQIDAREKLDRIIVRDTETSLILSRVIALRSRLWAYVLEEPSLFDVDPDSKLVAIATNAGGLFVQTDAARAILESVVPQANGHTWVLPPMVRPMESAPEAATQVQPDGPVRFVYSGKYSKLWNVEPYFNVPALCRLEGIEASVTMIGDKVHNEPSDQGFRTRILNKFEATDGVTWLGAMSRTGAMEASVGHHLGLCWRSEEMDASLEISTKFLEFGSLGIPTILNRTASYVALLGEDYPYFAASQADLVAAASIVTTQPEIHAQACQKVLDVARRHLFPEVARNLTRALRLDAVSATSRLLPSKVLVASHDVKFLRSALDLLGMEGRLIYDHWTSTMSHNAERSMDLLMQADSIFCEWCCGNAMWYSRNKLPHQKLYIRLHRFEAFGKFPASVAIDAVDGVIVVSDHFRDICVREFGWPAERITVLPQYCNAAQFNRPKHAGAEHVLGFVGINGFSHKRFDRAVDILRRVRETEPRFSLRIRSAMPWEFDWFWKDNPQDRARFTATFARIEEDPLLRDSVLFDQAGPDMAEWFRKSGYILSTSETEGCHTSVAEGMASGSMPIVIDWPGAQSVYGADNTFSSVEAMADTVLATAARPSVFFDTMEERKREAVEKFDIGRTVAHLQSWFRL